MFKYRGNAATIESVTAEIKTIGKRLDGSSPPDLASSMFGHAFRETAPKLNRKSLSCSHNAREGLE
jgi:hypothetical protein